MARTAEKLLVLPATFTDTELANIWNITDAQRYGIVKRAIARGDIIHIKRGLYCLAEKYRKTQLNLFEVAQKIYGPSYVSFESALSYHGWIPEAVHTVTSVSLKRSKIFKTDVGLFSFVRVSVNSFLTQVDRVIEERAVFLIARPWRAIADYVFANKKDWKGISPLVKSLRIEEENLFETTIEELNEIASIYASHRVKIFIKKIIKDLKL